MMNISSMKESTKTTKFSVASGNFRENQQANAIHRKETVEMEIEESDLPAEQRSASSLQFERHT